MNFLTPEQEMWRATVERFVDEEIGRALHHLHHRATVHDKRVHLGRVGKRRSCLRRCLLGRIIVLEASITPGKPPEQRHEFVNLVVCKCFCILV